MELYFNAIFLKVAVFLFAIWLGNMSTSVYYRLPNDIPIGPNFKPVCDYCGKRISFKYFFPIIGYLISGGKCIYCKKQIPKIYLLLELLIAFFVILLSFQYYVIDEKFISKSFLCAFLITLLVIYETHKKITKNSIWILLTFLLLCQGYNNNLPSIIGIFFNCIIGYSSVEIVKRSIKIDALEGVMSIIILSFLPIYFSYIFFIVSLILFVIKKILIKINDKYKFYIKKIHIIVFPIISMIVYLFYY